MRNRLQSSDQHSGGNPGILETVGDGKEQAAGFDKPVDAGAIYRGVGQSVQYVEGQHCIE